VFCFLHGSTCPDFGHWSFLQVGHDITPTQETPLMEVLQKGLEKYLPELGLISLQASKEYALEKVCYIFLFYDIQVLANNTLVQWR